MVRPIALVGAGEYVSVMDGLDRHPPDSVNANGRSPRVVCLPTAARQGRHASVDRWMTIGKEHTVAPGATVDALPTAVNALADDVQYAPILEAGDVIRCPASLGARGA
jgi:hypothetical protein